MPGSLERPDYISVLSVEDHPIYREGLSTIIGAQADMRLVAQAASAEEALATFRRHRPDVTLMDLRLPDADGIDTLAAIREEFPSARLIVLSTSDGDGDISRALQSGAAGYVLKSAPRQDLLAAIRMVHAGGRYVRGEAASRLAEHLGDRDLTPRELEVLGLIRDGLVHKQIARRLSITETTVNYHIRNLVQKLGAKGRTHAVAIAIRRGFLKA